jgi:hypothetical protein
MLKARLVWNKFKAEDLLSNMTGIVEIINKLVVVPTETRIDQAISEEITASLERNIHGELKEVNVPVKDQVVTLTGKVPGWEIYHLVRDVLRYTLGVIDVRNMFLAQNVSSLMAKKTPAERRTRKITVTTTIAVQSLAFPPCGRVERTDSALAADGSPEASIAGESLRGDLWASTLPVLGLINKMASQFRHVVRVTGCARWSSSMSSLVSQIGHVNSIFISL